MLATYRRSALSLFAHQRHLLRQDELVGGGIGAEAFFCCRLAFNSGSSAQEPHPPGGGSDTGASVTRTTGQAESSTPPSLSRRRGRRVESPLGRQTPADVFVPAVNDETRGQRREEGREEGRGRDPPVPAVLGSRSDLSRGGSPAAALPLALQNAPRRVHELIGDPRTGVADDVSGSGAFGEVTVDMVHHQISNEVYWYKYEFAGGVLKETHRDARLSDYTKTLIYVLRAKDPTRWTIAALAEKFAVRKQRILAVLALKELESQRLEAGRLMRGPLRAYAIPVRLEDVVLDPASGQPIAFGAFPAPQLLPGTPEELGGSSGGATFTMPPAWHLAGTLPELVHTAEQTQLAFLELLQPYGYSATELRAAVLAQLDSAEKFYQQHFPSGPSRQAAAEPGEAAPPLPSSAGGDAAAPSAPAQLLDFARYRRCVEALLAAATPFLDASQVTEEHSGASLLQQTQHLLAMALAADPDEATELTKPGSDSSHQISGLPQASPAEGLQGAGVALGEGMRVARDQLRAALVAPVGGSPRARGAAVERVLLGLPELAQRKLLLALLPELVPLLRRRGLDVWQATQFTVGPAHTGPPAVSSSGPTGLPDAEHEGSVGHSGWGRREKGRQRREELQALEMPFDIFGFQKIPGVVFRHTAAALDGLDSLMAELAGRLSALGAAEAPSPPPSVGATELLALRELLRTYRSADLMSSKVAKSALAWDDTNFAAGRRPRAPRQGWRQELTLEERDQLQRILLEMGPDAVDKVERHIKLSEVRDPRERDELTGLLAEAEERQLKAQMQAAAARLRGTGDSKAVEGGPRAPKQFNKVNWDLFAAYMDKVAGRRFHRGSGERLIVRLPTFPAFEGYSLDEFDKLEEGEVSRLNREAAVLQDTEMYRRFQDSLLYNLGVRGEALRGPRKGRPAPDLRATTYRPIVVYDVAADGTTRYPPLFVASKGKRRPLNEQEQVHQERRGPKSRLAYHIQRIKRLPDLE